MKKIKNLFVDAFTLQELLIVLVIIGILVLLALPSLTPLITKAKSTEAKLQLEHLYKLQKIHFMEHSVYASKTDQLGFEHSRLVSDNPPGNANYRIDILHADTREFLARASAVVDFDGDGIYNVWEINQENQIKETIKD